MGVTKTDENHDLLFDKKEVAKYLSYT